MKKIGIKLSIIFILASNFADANAVNNPYLGQLMLSKNTACPTGWLPAEGQLLAIAANTALFNLIGTTYGGNGRENFALPDLRGRMAVGEGTGPGLTRRRLGQKGGTESFTLTINELPRHNHSFVIKGGLGVTTSASNNFFAESPIYRNGVNTKTLHVDTVSHTGESSPEAVTKVSPYITLTYCIATQGDSPS